MNRLSTRKHYAFATLAGMLAALTLPPLYLVFLLFPAFSLLYLLINQPISKRKAFFTGWWWGMGYFTPSLYWICISLYVEPEKFAWLTPFALLGLPSILGIYIGLATLASHLIFKKKPLPEVLKVLIFAVMLGCAEYVRGHLFTGFPWNLIGYSMSFSDISIQSVKFGGIYGLSVMVIVLSTLPALYFTTKNWLIPNLAGAIIIIAYGVFGTLTLQSHPTHFSQIKLRLVQGNIPQTAKMTAQHAMEGLKKYRDLSISQPLEGIAAVIWPEGAIPYYVASHQNINQQLVKDYPGNTLLLAGGLGGLDDAQHWQTWNSLFVLDNAGNIKATYNKHHLVPFGEYIPFRNILPLENIAGGHGDFEEGKGADTIQLATLPPFSPLICYEAIFPEIATDHLHKAKWLLNITNDAWFGTSSGPYQHLAMARMRAVENHLPLVRVANTGVSAIIDPMGRVVATLPLNHTGLLDYYLPDAE